MIDLLFFAWLHLDDTTTDAILAADALARYIFSDPVSALKWPDALASDSELVNSLVVEYGPHGLAQRTRAALEALVKHFNKTGGNINSQWNFYAQFTLHVMVMGVSCHVKCRRLIPKHGILPALEKFSIVLPQRHRGWPALASVILSVIA